MEKINTESLISSLFILGFDRVDSVLFTYTLGKLSLDDKEQQFCFEEHEPSIVFKNYVDYDGNVYKLKDGVTLDTMATYNDEVFYPLRKMLNSNKKLIEYLSQLNFVEIVSRKAKSYGIKSIEDALPILFSEKEICILKSAQMDNYFRVTFGMKYDTLWNPLYYNAITFNTGSGEHSVLMYAHYVDGVLREVITGMEIPRVLYKSIPGFGAYELRCPCDIREYEKMKKDLEFSKENIELFKKALEEEKNWLGLDHDEYVTTTKITTSDGEKSLNDKEFIESEGVRLSKLIASINNSFGNK